MTSEHLLSHVVKRDVTLDAEKICEHSTPPLDGVSMKNLSRACIGTTFDVGIWHIMISAIDLNILDCSSIDNLLPAQEIFVILEGW
jgi:hypothetical protein